MAHGNAKFLGNTKICSRCGIEKPKSEFNKRPSRPCGVVSNCRVCEKIIRAENKEYYKKQGAKYYKENKDEIDKKNKLWVKNNPEKAKAIRDKWRSDPINKKKDNEYSKAYSKKHSDRDREKRNISHKAWKSKNKDHVKKYYREYKKQRSEKDIDFLLKTRICANFRTKMNRNINKKYDTFFNYTNTSLNEYVSYLKEDPLWDRYQSGEKIHIDHIIPCNIYDFNNKDHVCKCWDKRNLRLLEASENISKRDNLVPELIREYEIEDLLPKGVTID